MARKRTTPTVNPLQRMLGTYLRIERHRLGLRTIDVAEALDLSEVYFRSVESGGAALNLSLVFKFLEILAARGSITSAPLKVHHQRLALFLLGSHWVGSEMVALREKSGADLRAMEMLAKKDEDFRIFHHRTRRYYALIEDQRKQFLTDEAAPQVADFLGNLAYARPTKEKETLLDEVLPSHTVLAMPTMNVEMVRRLIVDLSGRPFVHSPHLAAEWESRMSPTFRNVRGVYARADMIISSKNLGLFHYPYLFERSCREVRFLFLEVASPEKIKTRFIKQLNIARRAAGLDEIGPIEVKKLHVACLSPNKLGAADTRLSTLLRRTDAEQRYNAYWSFDTTAEIPIGFVGAEGATAHDIWNLSLEESFAKRAEFDKLWSEVHGDQS